MIDHERKFIFVHIPKTAGTSMEVALADAWNNQQKYFIGKDNHLDVWTTHFSIKEIHSSNTSFLKAKEHQNELYLSTLDFG